MANRLTSGDRSVAGRVAIITGAGSGMGRATAHLFADEGARVAICDLNGAGLEAVRAEIEEAYGTEAVLAERVDVADLDQLTDFVDRAVQRFGQIDIVVNNAGVAIPTPLDGSVSVDDYLNGWQATKK